MQKCNACELMFVYLFFNGFVFFVILTCIAHFVPTAPSRWIAIETCSTGTNVVNEYHIGTNAARVLQI